MLQQIRNWLWNRREGKIAAGKKQKNPPLDLLVKKSSHMHPYQAYMRLYKKKIIPAIKVEYKEYEEKCKSGDAGDPIEPDDWWKFACARARVLYENETDEVKKEVEEFREKNTDVINLEQFYAADNEGMDESAELAKTANNLQGSVLIHSGESETLVTYPHRTQPRGSTSEDVGQYTRTYRGADGVEGHNPGWGTYAGKGQARDAVVSDSRRLAYSYISTCGRVKASTAAVP